MYHNLVDIEFAFWTWTNKRHVALGMFINEGETIEIDTRDGSYVSRVKA